MHRMDLHTDVTLSYVGPDLREGPLPALFYIALSAHETLAQDPYNQPVLYLSGLPLRIFSLDLPAHGEHLSSRVALKSWHSEFEAGKDVISLCADCISEIIRDLIHKEIIIADKMALMGLSRGGMIASHVAVRCPNVQWILGFAPLTVLSATQEFHSLHEDPRIAHLNLVHIIPHLADRHVRFYIGNHDIRVGTRNCFDFIEKLAQKGFERGQRSPKAELIIAPSIGFQGHGTSKQTFHHGAQWIAEQLSVIDVR